MLWIYVVWRSVGGWGYLGKDEFDESRRDGMELVQGVVRIHDDATYLLGVGVKS